MCIALSSRLLLTRWNLNQTVTSKFLAYTALPFDQNLSFPSSCHLYYLALCFYFVLYLRSICFNINLVIIKLPLISDSFAPSVQKLNYTAATSYMCPLFLNTFHLVQIVTPDLLSSPCRPENGSMFLFDRSKVCLTLCIHVQVLSHLCQKLNLSCMLIEDAVFAYHGVDVKVLKSSHLPCLTT